MMLDQLFREALRSLMTNKLRSLLTILGIVIGVASVIAMVSLGRGVQGSLNEQFASMGTTQIGIMSQFDPSLTNPKPLTLSDLEALSDPENVPSVLRAAASVSGYLTTSYGSESTSGNVYGVSANYGEMNGYKLTEGRFLNVEDVLGQSSVAVIGSLAAKKLFDRQNGIVGEMVRIDGQPYRVVGVLESRGISGFGLSAGDGAVLVPLSTAQMRLMPRAVRDQVDQIDVQLRDTGEMDASIEQIKQVLRLRHRTPVGVDDFYVFVPSQLLDALNQVTSVMTVFLGGVAAISLLVGGIGIMNIMLVSVTERTREIGLRKAIGASRRDILMQFLTESVVLSLLGGTIGILSGWLIGLAISLYAQQSGTDLSVAMSPDAVLLATLFSSAIGIFFGFYPANRAANLMPVEALRSE
jgi:putative ABC transport system permease protein